jgi:hypothetical protein
MKRYDEPVKFFQRFGKKRSGVIHHGNKENIGRYAKFVNGFTKHVEADGDYPGFGKYRRTDREKNSRPWLCIIAAQVTWQRQRSLW